MGPATESRPSSVGGIIFSSCSCLVRRRPAHGDGAAIPLRNYSLCSTVKACLGVTLTTKREFISASPCWVVEALNPRFCGTGILISTVLVTGQMRGTRVFISFLLAVRKSGWFSLWVFPFVFLQVICIGHTVIRLGVLFYLVVIEWRQKSIKCIFFKENT